MTASTEVDEAVSDRDYRELLRAWSEWEQHPAWEQNVLRMELACRKIAPTLSLTSTELRIVLTALRRQGLEPRDAVARVLELFAASRPVGE